MRSRVRLVFIVALLLATVAISEFVSVSDVPPGWSNPVDRYAIVDFPGEGFETTVAESVIDELDFEEEDDTASMDSFESLDSALRSLTADLEKVGYRDHHLGMIFVDADSVVGIENRAIEIQKSFGDSEGAAESVLTVLRGQASAHAGLMSSTLHLIEHSAAQFLKGNDGRQLQQLKRYITMRLRRKQGGSLSNIKEMLHLQHIFNCRPSDAPFFEETTASVLSGCERRWLTVPSQALSIVFFIVILVAFVIGQTFPFVFVVVAVAVRSWRRGGGRSLREKNPSQSWMMRLTKSSFGRVTFAAAVMFSGVLDPLQSLIPGGDRYSFESKFLRTTDEAMVVFGLGFGVLLFLQSLLSIRGIVRRS